MTGGEELKIEPKSACGANFKLTAGMVRRAGSATKTRESRLGVDACVSGRGAAMQGLVTSGER
jgi:hypothetical protein